MSLGSMARLRARMPSIDLNIRHPSTPKALLGGGSAVTIHTDALKRARNTEKPKVSSPHAYHGDHVLTRTGKRGALVLGRLAKAFAPKVQPGIPGHGRAAQAQNEASASAMPPALHEPELPEVLPQSFSTRMSTFERCVSEMRGEINRLHAQQSDPLSTPKERIAGEIAAVATQTKLKSDVDKALGELGRLLSEKAAALEAAESSMLPHQATIDVLEDEIAQLTKMRRALIEIAIGADFGGLAGLDDEPLPAGGNARIRLSQAVFHFEALLDRFDSTFEPPAPPAAHPFPNGFPLSAAMQAISSAFPHAREFGNSGNIRQLEAAATAVAHVAEMIVRGETMPALHGIDLNFDKAVLPLKQAAGAYLAEVKLRWDRADGPFPSDAMLGLLDRADDQLTVWERAQMLDLVGEGRHSTLAQAREILKQARQEVEEARRAGSVAATMRHELTLMDKRLSQLLTVDRSNWRKPWTWGASLKKGQAVASTLAGVRIDAQFMKGLHGRFGRNAGKEVAILAARFAHLQRQTILQEQQALGLHEGFEFDGTPSTGQPYRQVDPDHPLGHFGISNQDLADIGLSPSDIRDVGEVVEQLARQGVASIEAVHDAVRAINDVSRIVLKSESFQETILVYGMNMARAQGQHLLRDILTDSVMRYRSAHLAEPPREEDPPIRATDPEVAGHFQDRNTSLKRALGEDGMARLRTESEACRRLETTMAALYRDHMAIDTEIERRRSVLAGAHEKFGITVDPESPRGLRSARQILVVLDAEAVMADGDASPQEKEDARVRQQDALERLRGFDARRMRQGWQAKAFNRISDRVAGAGAAQPDIDMLRDLKEVAEAIVHVRETGPAGKLQLERELPQHGTVLEGLVAARRDREPAAMAHVTTMVRAAVLAEWQNARTDLNVGGGRVSEGFDPSSTDNRRKIQATLKAWGLDVEAFTPEIDSVLFSRMTPDDIAIWRQETRFSNAMIERMTSDGRPMLDLDRIMGRRVMDTQTRENLLAMLEGLQEGDKLDLKTGQRISVDTGKLPVEPQGLAFIRARLAQAHIGQFEIEMGSDGFKLHVRTGGEGRGNLDGGVGRKLGKDHGPGPALEARLEASIGLEGAASRVRGVSFSFDKGLEGRQALIGLVGRMIDGDPITFKDWQSSTDVGTTDENRVKGGVTVRGDARVGVGGKPDRDKATNTKLDDEFVGVDTGGGVSAGAAIGGKWVGIESLNQVTRKGEVEVLATFGGNAGIHAQFWNVMNMATGQMGIASGGQGGAQQHFGSDGKGKPLYNISNNAGNYDLLNVGLTATASAVRKWKLVTNRDGRYLGAEKVRQSTGSAGPVAAFGACLDTPQMRAILNGDRPQDRAFLKELATFMGLKGPRDHIAVSYGLKPGVLDRANALAARAISARRGGDKTLAAKYEAAAEAIMHDDDNYMPTKIGLITTEVQKREDTVVSARWIRWDTFSDGKSEHRGVVLNIPGS